MEQKKHIDFGDPNTTIIIGLAFISDALFFLFPIHYAMALYAGVMLFPSLRGFMAKTLFLIGAILPLPLFGIMIVASVALTNSKIVRFVVSAAKEIAIQVAAVALSEFGVGEAIEAARAGEAIKAVTKGAQAIKKGAKAIRSVKKTEKVMHGVAKAKKAERTVQTARKGGQTAGRAKEITETINKDSTGKIKKAVVDETKRYIREQALEDWDEQTQQDLFDNMTDEDLEQMINDYLNGDLSEAA